MFRWEWQQDRRCWSWLPSISRLLSVHLWTNHFLMTGTFRNNRHDLTYWGFFSCIFSWLSFPLWFTLRDFSISWWGTEVLLLSSVSSWTCEMWMALGADPIVAGQIMEMVMEKLAIMAPYVDKKESMIRGGTIKVATNPPLAVSHKHSEVIHPFQVQYLVLTVLPSI